MDRLLDPNRITCEKCEKLHEGWGKEPKCEECIPPLFRENQEAARTYLVCKNQFIMSMGGPVALDIGAIEIAMKRCKVKNTDAVFRQVINLGQHFIQKMREKE